VSRKQEQAKDVAQAAAWSAPKAAVLASAPGTPARAQGSPPWTGKDSLPSGEAGKGAKATATNPEVEFALQTSASPPWSGDAPAVQETLMMSGTQAPSKDQLSAELAAAEKEMAAAPQVPQDVPQEVPPEALIEIPQYTKKAQLALELAKAERELVPADAAPQEEFIELPQLQTSEQQLSSELAKTEKEIEATLSSMEAPEEAPEEVLLGQHISKLGQPISKECGMAKSHCSQLHQKCEETRHVRCARLEAECSRVLTDKCGGMSLDEATKQTPQSSKETALDASMPAEASTLAHMVAEREKIIEQQQAQIMKQRKAIVQAVRHGAAAPEFAVPPKPERAHGGAMMMTAPKPERAQLPKAKRGMAAAKHAEGQGQISTIEKETAALFQAAETLTSATQKASKKQRGEEELLAARLAAAEQRINTLTAAAMKGQQQRHIKALRQARVLRARLHEHAQAWGAHTRRGYAREEYASAPRQRYADWSYEAPARYEDRRYEQPMRYEAQRYEDRRYEEPRRYAAQRRHEASRPRYEAAPRGPRRPARIAPRPIPAAFFQEETRRPVEDFYEEEDEEEPEPELDASKLLHPVRAAQAPKQQKKNKQIPQKKPDKNSLAARLSVHAQPVQDRSVEDFVAQEAFKHRMRLAAKKKKIDWSKLIPEESPQERARRVMHQSLHELEVRTEVDGEQSQDMVNGLNEAAEDLDQDEVQEQLPDSMLKTFLPEEEMVQEAPIHGSTVPKDDLISVALSRAGQEEEEGEEESLKENDMSYSSDFNDEY